jgi:hypothetical protein
VTDCSVDRKSPSPIVRRAAVGVALAQHRVDRAALDAVVRLGIVLVLGEVVARLLELRDRRLELRHGGADVRELDDVGVGLLGELAELGQRVGDAMLGELRQDAAGQRDVAKLELDARGGAVGLDDR